MNIISDESEQSTSIIRLESWQFKYAEKRIEGVTSMTVKNQQSNAPCILGKSFGFDGNKIWVDKGCRADFEVTISKS